MGYGYRLRCRAEGSGIAASWCCGMARVTAHSSEINKAVDTLEQLIRQVAGLSRSFGTALSRISAALPIIARSPMRWRREQVALQFPDCLFQCHLRFAKIHPERRERLSSICRDICPDIPSMNCASIRDISRSRVTVLARWARLRRPCRCPYVTAPAIRDFPYHATLAQSWSAYCTCTAGRRHAACWRERA